jgi:hypothetical protein
MANTSIHPRQISYARSLSEHLSRTPEGQRLRLGGAGTASLAAWFLGPAAENQALLESLLHRTLEAHCEARRAIGDPAYVTEARRDEAFHRAARAMEQQLDAMLAQLSASVPFLSHRYQAHMLWDLTIPGMVGYFAGMLYNQNNVAAETSPVTAQLEREVGQDLCRMLGFEPRSCGEAFLRSFMRRMGLEDARPMPIDFLSSTTMSPWLTATAVGNFIPELIRPLRAKILELAEAFRGAGRA